MDQKEFLRFVEEILKNNEERGIQDALVQFADILERNNFDEALVGQVLELKNLKKETFELKKQCLNTDLSLTDLDDAIKRGRLRLQREAEMRRGRC